MSSYLCIVEQDPTFTFALGTGSQDYVVVDRGDVYLFDSVLLVAKASLAIPVSYSLDYGSYDFTKGLLDHDTNGDKVLVQSEYIPASPFLTLLDAAPMNAIKTDLISACDKAMLGIDATLAETSDDYDLIPWHTAGSGLSQDDLNSAKVAVQQVKDALSKTVVLPMVWSVYEIFDYSWYWNEIPGGEQWVDPWAEKQVQYALVKMNLLAWSDNPPADLKAFAPKLQIIEQDIDNGMYHTTWKELRPVLGSYADPTFGGLFPEGLPDEMLYGTLVPPDTGNIGVIIK